MGVVCSLLLLLSDLPVGRRFAGCKVPKLAFWQIAEMASFVVRPFSRYLRWFVPAPFQFFACSRLLFAWISFAFCFSTCLCRVVWVGGGGGVIPSTAMRMLIVPLCSPSGSADRHSTAWGPKATHSPRTLGMIYVVQFLSKAMSLLYAV